MPRTVTDENLADWLAYAQTVVAFDYAKFMPTRLDWTPVLQFADVAARTKYAKVFTDNGNQKRVIGFINLVNGDVLKADGWKKPALNFARGNIDDAEHGLGRMAWTGVY
jgi:hypothetical protein